LSCLDGPLCFNHIECIYLLLQFKDCATFFFLKGVTLSTMDVLHFLDALDGLDGGDLAVLNFLDALDAGDVKIVGDDEEIERSRCRQSFGSSKPK